MLRLRPLGRLSDPRASPRTTFVACTTPVEEEDPNAHASDELIRGGGFDPGGPIVILPDYCAGATGSITAAPSAINFGATVTTQWSANVPAGCAMPVKINGEVVAASGSKVVKPLSNYAYVLSIGSKTLSYANVNVTLPSTVRIKGNTNEWKALLVQAVGTANTRVVLENGVDMDLSEYENILVRQGVTLTSEKPAVLEIAGFTKGTDFSLPGVIGRDPRTLGPRLYTNTRPKPLFHIACTDSVWGDNVSSQGRNPFKTFATMSWPDTAAMQAFKPANSVRSLVGRFRGLVKDDLLAIDFTRMGQIFGAGSTAFAPHSRYAY